MEQKIGIIYHSVDGQTKKICERLHHLFKKKQINVTLCSISEFNNTDMLAFHTIIIGASIRYGKHHRSISDFIKNNINDLNKIQTAFFSVNLVARKEEKNSVDTNPYMIKFLKEIKWKADFLEVFAGKLDYKSYSFIDLSLCIILKNPYF